MSLKKIVGWVQILSGAFILYISFVRWVSSSNEFLAGIPNAFNGSLTSIEVWVMDMAPVLSITLLLIGLVFIIQGILNIKKQD